MNDNTMSNKLYFTIYSPRAVYFSDYVKAVTIPSMSGTFQVLQNHAPILAAIEYGPLDIVTENGIKTSFFVEGGIAHAHKNILKVNISEIDKLSEIDIEKVKTNIADETETMNNAAENNIKQACKTKIKKLEMKLKLAQDMQK